MKGIVLLLGLCCQLSLAFGQASTFDRDKWNTLKQEVDFRKNDRETEDQNKAEAPQGTGKEKRPRSSSGGSSPTTINLGPVLQIILIAAFAVILIFLIYTILSNSGFYRLRSRKLSNSDRNPDLENTQELPLKSDLDRWLAMALEKRDYRLAIRVYFLMALNGLEHRKLIRWEKEKTNWDYINELEGHRLQQPFQNLSLEFNTVWYGEKGYTDETLKQKLDTFNGFQQLLKSERSE